ncbi:MAG: glycosyltransferase [Actinomycetota bacterium]
MTTVFVTVGTETYPFQRLIGWVDTWAGSAAAEGARVIVQYGTARPPVHAEGHDYLPFDRVRSLLEEADAVVCHGGTGSVMLARAAGRLPIVVPRLGSEGEHVDDHQVEFAQRLAGLGKAVLAANEADLTKLLDAATSGARSFRAESGDPNVTEAIARFASLVDGVVPGEGGSGA